MRGSYPQSSQGTYPQNTVPGTGRIDPLGTASGTVFENAGIFAGRKPFHRFPEPPGTGSQDNGNRVPP